MIAAARSVLCRIGFHNSARRTATVVEEDGTGHVASRCVDCDRTVETRSLDPSELCEVIGHDPGEFSDRIDAVGRDERSGELVELCLVRVHLCKRCASEVETPVPPELVPADVFERVERELADKSSSAAVEKIDLDLGDRRTS